MAADTPSIQDWINIGVGLTVILSFVGVTWVKGIRPLLRKLDYVEGQMKPNGGRARDGGAHTLRDVTENTKEDVEILAQLIENVRTRTEERHEENRAAIIDLGDRLEEGRAAIAELAVELGQIADQFAHHLDTAGEREAGRVGRQNEIEQRQRDAISWGLRTMTEFRERLDALDHQHTHQARPEPEEPNQ